MSQISKAKFKFWDCSYLIYATRICTSIAIAKSWVAKHLAHNAAKLLMLKISFWWKNLTLLIKYFVKMIKKNYSIFSYFFFTYYKKELKHLSYKDIFFLTPKSNLTFCTLFLFLWRTVKKVLNSTHKNCTVNCVFKCIFLNQNKTKRLITFFI